MEIEVQSPYDTKVGAGPIITGRNWRSSPRMNKIGAFSFDMPLNDPRRSYLVQKRYVRCYGIVNDTRTELGKPGIIDSVVKKIDANGVPTGMLRVSGRDLLAELADITIHELSLFDTSTRTPDSVQYWDGTASTFLNMANAKDDTAASVEIPADDEDYLYIGDDDPFDIVVFDLGTNLNDDHANFKVWYSTGSESWSSGTILSDTTKIDNASFAQDGSIRWERQEDWATDEVNSVADKYWLRFRYGEDMSGDVTIVEIDVTQEVPTSTALAKWLAYADAEGVNPISDLTWAFETDLDVTENTIFLMLRDVSAFEALTLIAEQTGENFRLGTGRKIEWLQDTKTASGVRATNVSDGIAAQDNEDICLITNLRETEDSYEVVSRIYPQGGGRGSTRITLLECTETEPGGYTLETAYNYLKKDSVEQAAPTGYGRRIEITKFWPGVASPSWASSHDANSSNALYKLAYEYLSRHWEPQKSYIFSVVKLDAEVKVGETIQLVYWQTVEGVAVWNLGIASALHLWVLEVTHAVDEAGTRVIGMQVATIDAWPSSDAGKVKNIVSHIKALQSTDGPTTAASLTAGSVADLLANLDLSAYAKLASDETITGGWTFDDDLGIGTSTPRVVASLTYTAGRHLNVKHATERARISIQGHTEGAALNLVDLDGAENDKWMQLVTYDGETWFRSSYDDGQTLIQDDILLMDHGTGDVTIGAGDLILVDDLKLADGAVVGIAGNEVITFNAAGTIAITGADILTGSEDGGGKLNFDEGTAIADGIVWGSDGNKVTLYRSADDMLKTDDSLTVAVGLNIGAGTGATLGDIFAESSTTLKPEWRLTNTNADADSAGLIFVKDSASPANNDLIGTLTFHGDDSNGNPTRFVFMRGRGSIVADGSEQGSLDCYLQNGGVESLAFSVAGIDFSIAGDLTVAQGLNVGTATGAVVNQVLIGAPVSSKMTIGITINQAGNDDEILALQSSDVGHGATAIADTDTFGAFGKVEGGSGGLWIKGLKDADGVNYAAIYMEAFLAENVDTTKDATGQGIIEIIGYQTAGASIADVVANGNVVTIHGRRGGATVTLWILDEDGDVYIDGTQNTYDEFDDAVMAWDATRVLANRGGDILRYNKEALVKAGVMSPAGWISQRGTTKLLMGAVGQLWQENRGADAEREAIRARLDDIEGRG